MLQNWKISLEERGLALNTKQDAYAVLRATYNYAIKMDYLQSNPLYKVGNFKDTMFTKKNINFYTPDEFKLFIAAAKEAAIKEEQTKGCLSEWDYYVFFNIAFYTGLRKGEIHGLQWNDIDGKYLSVNRSVAQKLIGDDVVTPPKNKSSVRTLQMPKALIAILDEHRQRQKLLGIYSDEHRILGDKRSLRDTTIQNHNIKYAKAAGVKTIRIHDFRHSHASFLANMGINIQEVGRRLGHSKIEMTWNVYSHLYPKAEEQAVKVLDEM